MANCDQAVCRHATVSQRLDVQAGSDTHLLAQQREFFGDDLPGADPRLRLLAVARLLHLAEYAGEPAVLLQHLQRDLQERVLPLRLRRRLRAARDDPAAPVADVDRIAVAGDPATDHLEAHELTRQPGLLDALERGVIVRLEAQHDHQIGRAHV
mgnify:CR=1 FL=1